MFVYAQRVPTVPHVDRVLAICEVPDPWSANTPTRFELVLFRLVSERTQKGNFGNLIGLRNTRNGEEKMLPEALVLLWQNGEVPVEQLPALLHASGTRYDMGDAELMMRVTRHIWFSAILFIVALGCSIYGLNAWFATRAAAPHRMHEETVAALSSRPLREYEAIHSNESLPLLSSEPALASPPNAPGLYALPDAELAVVEMGTRKRLVWMAMRSDVVVVLGVVWPLRELGPTVQRAADVLAAKYPGLERDVVLGQMWMWIDGYKKRNDMLTGFSIGAICFVTAAFIYLFVARRKKQRRRGMDDFRGLARQHFTLQGAGVSSRRG